jgi:hypothetical protein
MILWNRCTFYFISFGIYTYAKKISETSRKKIFLKEHKFWTLLVSVYCWFYDGLLDQALEVF